MNAVELTELFVQYKKTADLLAELEEKIKSEVMLLGESQKIAGVKATYYQPSVRYDYQAACKNMPEGALDDVINEHSTVSISTRWAEVAKAADVPLADYAEDVPARVVVK